MLAREDGSPLLNECKYLNLSSTNLGATGMRHLANALPRHLVVLTLCNNKFGDAGIEILMAALPDYRELPAVKVLRSLIGSEAYDVLGSYIGGVLGSYTGGATTLLEINVSECEITERGLPAIERALSWYATPDIINLNCPETRAFKRFKKTMGYNARTRRARKVRAMR